MKKRLAALFCATLAASMILVGCQASKGLETDNLKITQYKGVEVSAVAKPEKVTDDDVEQYIQSQLTSSATTTEVTDRAAQKGDTVDIAFAGTIDGEAFDGGSSDSYSLELGSGKMIDGFEDIMGMETGFLQYAMELLKKDYSKELQILKIQLPKVDQIPAVRFDKAKELVSEKYNRKIRNPYDLEPEEEALIGRYFKEEYDADFVFVTHYPSKKRPFYAMDDPQDDKFTLSFDLLFHGLEVTTGGQRIHDYNQLKAKIAARGMEEEGMEQYLDTFKHGMPPHGGLGIGLERLTMQLLGEENVREACLFPRDLNRLEP